MSEEEKNLSDENDNNNNNNDPQQNEEQEQEEEYKKIPGGKKRSKVSQGKRNQLKKMKRQTKNKQKTLTITGTIANDEDDKTEEEENEQQEEHKSSIYNTTPFRTYENISNLVRNGNDEIMSDSSSIYDSNRETFGNNDYYQNNDRGSSSHSSNNELIVPNINSFNQYNNNNDGLNNMNINYLNEQFKMEHENILQDIEDCYNDCNREINQHKTGPNIELLTKFGSLIQKLIQLGKESNVIYLPYYKDFLVRNFGLGDTFENANPAKVVENDFTMCKKPFVEQFVFMVEKSLIHNSITYNEYQRFQWIINKLSQLRFIDFNLLCILIKKRSMIYDRNYNEIMNNNIEKLLDLPMRLEDEGEKENIAYKLYLEVGKSCINQDLRRNGNWIYRPKYTTGEKIYHTRYYELYAELDRYIYSVINSGSYFVDCLNNRNIVSSVVTFFLKDDKAFQSQTTTSIYLPHIEINREYISLKNGIYCFPTDTFYPYDINIKPTSSVYLNETDIPKLDTYLVTCNYIDIEMIHCYQDNWREIPTPALDSIFSHQGHYTPSLEKILKQLEERMDIEEDEEQEIILTNNNDTITNDTLLDDDINFQRIDQEEDLNSNLNDHNNNTNNGTNNNNTNNGTNHHKFYLDEDDLNIELSEKYGIPIFNFKYSGEWMYALLGRGFYWLKKLDSWDNVFYIIGYAGTGKSLLLHNLANVYNINDIGIVANKTEEKWNLSGIHDKYLVICPELQKNAQWEQAEFQQCAAGEMVELKEKMKTKRCVEWRTPIYLAGNEMIQTWRDIANCLGRRLIVFFFKKFVKSNEADPNLKKKLKEEITFFIQKSNRAYLECVKLYHNKVLSEVLPDNLKQSTREAVSITNPLSLFFSDSSLYIIGPGLRTEFDAFKNFFENWFHNEGFIKVFKWTKDFYSATFDLHGLKIIDATETDINTGRQTKVKYIENLKLNSDIVAQVQSRINNTTQDNNNTKTTQKRNYSS